MTSVDELDAVRASVRIDATPEEVFPYLVDASLLARWLADAARSDPTAGGELALDMGAIEVRGTYLEVDVPHRVLFTWGVPGSDDLHVGGSTVEITLRAEGDETVVDLVHRGLAPAQRERHLEGCLLYTSPSPRD